MPLPAVQAKLEQTRPVSASVHLVTLRVEAGFSFKAGQFVGVEIPGQSKPGYYSLASAPSRLPLLDLLVEHHESGPHSGPFSAWMVGRRPGDALTLQGPMGKFTLADPPAPRNYFLASGAGLAPLRGMLQDLLEHPAAPQAWLMLGFDGVEPLLDGEWKELQKARPAFHYLPVRLATPDNPWAGKQADPADTLLRHVRDKDGLRVYMAGFNRDLDPWSAKLAAAGYGRDILHVEKFG